MIIFHDFQLMKTIVWENEEEVHFGIKMFQKSTLLYLFVEDH